jgi:hypothetical protein
MTSRCNCRSAPIARVMRWPIECPLACSGVSSPRSTLLDVGVVAGQLLQLPVAQPVNAAVAGPDRCKVLLEDQQSDDRAAAQPGAVGALDQGAIAARERLVERLEQLARAARAAHAAQVADDQDAGIVAAIMAAHAVGNRPDAEIEARQAGFLV